MNKITDSIIYIGVNDKTLDLFEGQYIIPNGISYNSYVIMDEKIAIMDTVDRRKSEEWLENLSNALGTRLPDYLIVSHLEPDHAATIENVMEKYPDMQIVVNAKTNTMLPQFFELDMTDRMLVVAEGDELNLGNHTLAFFMAPMVHWPEVMVEYEKTEKVLFTADGFGKFGALDTDEDWACEARRYYFNIVGKYGAQVQSLLKKTAALEIEKICPLHGPILAENLNYYIDKYNTWSSYEAEDDGVLIAYASMHGNTGIAAKELAKILEDMGAEKVVVSDLAREDMAEVIEDAFRYDKVVFASATYDGGIAAKMEDFLCHLKSKNYRNRKIAFIENGSWAPVAGRKMREICENFKNVTLCENMVTIKSTVKSADIENLKTLAREILA